MLACKASIPSIFKILNQIVITKDVNIPFQSSWYDDRNIEPMIKPFQYFVIKYLDELEHPDLITERIYNIDTANYLKQ